MPQHRIRLPRPLQALPIAVLLLGIILRNRALLNHDVAWMLVAAQRMLDGGSYARDFFEVNMPLAILIYVPAAALMKIFALGANQACVLWVGALIAQSVWLILRVVLPQEQQTGEPQEGGAAFDWRPLLACWLVAALLFGPGYDFGQREHLIAILALPYLFAIAWPQAFARLGTAGRIHVCALAAIGLLIKPHYTGLLVLRFAILAVRRGFSAMLRSVDLPTFLSTALVYATVVILKYRDWFDCARWAVDLYGAYQARDLSALFQVQGLSITVACLLCQAGLFLFLPWLRQRLLPFLIACFYSLLVYFGQLKGWHYQLLTAELFAFAGLGVALFCIAQRLRQDKTESRSSYGAALASGLLLASTVFMVHTQETQPSAMRLGKALSALPKQTTIYAFSFELVDTFPAVPLFELNWGSRYSTLWPLLGIAVAENAPRTETTQHIIDTYRAPFLQSVVEDFQRYRPQIVLIDRRFSNALPDNFDIMADVRSNPDFAAIWRNYERTGCAATLRDDPSLCIFEMYKRRP